jgi:hypothetical protein
MYNESSENDSATGIGTGSFKPLTAGAPADLYRQRPREDGRYLQFKGADGFACFVHVKALMRMAAWGRAAGRSEVIGRLGGRPCWDNKGPYVIVERAALSRLARSSTSAVVSDLEAQKALLEDFDRCCHALDSVGWWHTHPDGIGLIYSSVDRENQATWTHRNSIGIVLNPELRGDALKVYRGPLSEELTCLSDLSGIATNAVAEPRGHRKARVPALAAALPARRRNVQCREQPKVQLGRPNIAATIAICVACTALLIATLALLEPAQIPQPLTVTVHVPDAQPSEEVIAIASPRDPRYGAAATKSLAPISTSFWEESSAVLAVGTSGWDKHNDTNAAESHSVDSARIQYASYSTATNGLFEITEPPTSNFEDGAEATHEE